MSILDGIYGLFDLARDSFRQGVDEALAKVWEEGVTYGADHPGTNPNDLLALNPYRAGDTDG